jgi:hypothetical protein
VDSPAPNLWGSLQTRQAREVVGLLSFKGAHVDENVQLDILRQQKPMEIMEQIVVWLVNIKI